MQLTYQLASPVTDENSMRHIIELMKLPVIGMFNGWVIFLHNTGFGRTYRCLLSDIQMLNMKIQKEREEEELKSQCGKLKKEIEEEKQKLAALQGRTGAAAAAASDSDKETMGAKAGTSE